MYKKPQENNSFSFFIKLKLLLFVGKEYFVSSLRSCAILRYRVIYLLDPRWKRFVSFAQVSRYKLQTKTRGGVSTLFHIRILIVSLVGII